jgi:hypothetical protein
MTAAYSISIASWSADSSSDPRTEVLAIDTFAALGAAESRARITLYAAPVDGRQLDFATGDPVSIDLTAGDVTETVFTGAVQGVRTSLGAMDVVASGGFGKLAATRINTIYSNQSAQQIANDLASQAGVDTGTVETGDTYQYVVAHESRTALDLLRRIARVEGMDLYADHEGHLTMKRFTKAAADYTFKYAVHVLDAQLLRHDVPTEHVLVAGESVASTQGNDRWHLIAKDASAYLGDAGSGTRLLAQHDGVVRTKAAAQRLADATRDAVAAYTTRGRLAVLGNPRVRLGDAVGVEDAPTPSLNATFKVAGVRHHFSKRRGHVTVIDVVAMAGAGAGLAGAAGGLAGGAGGFAGAAGMAGGLS